MTDEDYANMAIDAIRGLRAELVALERRPGYDLLHLHPADLADLMVDFSNAVRYSNAGLAVAILRRIFPDRKTSAVNALKRCFPALSVAEAKHLMESI